MSKTFWHWGAIGLVAVASGAQSSPEAAVAQDGSNEGILGEVVVTAQRRAEHLVDVPLSVDAVGPQQLETEHIDSLSDLTKAVTSLRFEGNEPSFSPTLRGIGTLVTGGGVDASVAVYEDGVYLPDTLGMNFDLPNVHDVQVLKGPQGTLFGRNTTGGAILISTEAPSFTSTEDLKATFASYDDRRIQGYLSGPISGSVAAGISAYYRESPGFALNIVDDAHDARVKMFNIRPNLLFVINEDLKVRLIYEHTYAFDASMLNLTNPDGYAVARNYPGALITSGLGSSFGTFASFPKPINLTKADSGTAIVDWNLGSSTTLKSITNYRTDSNNFDATGDESNLDLLTAQTFAKYETYSQEITVATKQGPLDLVAGANYYNSQAQAGFTILSLGTATVIPPSDIRTEAIGAFFDGTYGMTDGLFLTLGARLSSELKELIEPQPPAHDRWNSFTPRAVLRYQFDSSDDFYTSYSRGFKPGAYAGFPPNHVEPETVNAYELGFKRSSPLFDLNAATFLYDYKDFQVTTFDFTTDQGVTINAPAERSYGFELETAVRPTPHWRMGVSAAYLHAKFTDFPNATISEKQLIPVPDPAAPGGIQYVADGAWVSAPRNASGTVVPHAPRWTGNASSSYNFEIAPGRIGLAANLYVTTSLYNQMNEQFPTPGYAEIGLNASFIPRDTNWKAQMFVTNLTDKHRYVQYQGGPLGTYALWAWPRVIGGSLSYSF